MSTVTVSACQVMQDYGWLPTAARGGKATEMDKQEIRRLSNSSAAATLLSVTQCYNDFMDIFRMLLSHSVEASGRRK